MAIKYKAPKKRGDENELKEAIRQPEERPTGSVFGGEETDGEFDVQMDEGPKDIEERPGDAETIAPRMETALQAGGGDLASVTPDRQPQLEGAPAKEPDEPQGLFEDLGDIDTRQERERQAFADELEARRAEAMQQAQARAGLGGMGLSGATAELTADIGRQEARAGDIAMADLARRQQQETFDELRRQASIWGFEEEFGVDLDGDGVEGSPSGQEPKTPEESAADAERKNREVEQERKSSQSAMSEKIGTDVNSVDTPSSPLDLASPLNEDMGTYQDDAGFTWRVYRRPGGSFFKVMA